MGTCTSLHLTAPQGNRTLKLLIRGAKFWLDLLRSRKDAIISVSIWTRRILPDGFTFSIFVYTAAERFADFPASFFALCTRSPRLAADFFHSVPLVLPGHLPGAAGRAHVLRHRGLSPLFFAPLVQDQPRVPVCDRVHGHDLFPEGGAVVGGASSPPSPAFGPGTGFAFAHPYRVFLVARRLDYFGQVQRHAHRIHRGLCQVSRAALAEQVPSGAARRPGGGAMAYRGMAAVYLGLLREHDASVARYVHHQFALAPFRLAAL